MEIMFWVVFVCAIICFVIGWFFYYLSFPYWERKDIWEKYTWIGVISMSKRINRMREPGKTYAKTAYYFLNFTPVATIIVSLFLKAFGLL